MVKKYKTVSILYGGSGRNYATKMKNLIDKLSSEKKIPIRSLIVMDSILTGDLLSSITFLFNGSDLCVTFLTSDDLANGKGRLRQNVVFELGMAIFHLGKQKCILLSDFNPKEDNVELPSDLNGIEIKHFNKGSEDEVFKEVVKKVLLLSKDIDRLNGQPIELPSYDKLITREKYRVDYENLFEKTSDTLSLPEVLNDWYEECKSLNRYDERAIYFIERVGFLPIFGKRDGVKEWCIKIEPLLTTFSDLDIEEYSLSTLNFVKNTILALIEYVSFSFGFAPKKEKVYRDIVLALEEDCQSSEKSINPLIMTVYYDYLGLSYLHLYEFSKKENHLIKAIELFSILVDKYVDLIDTSMGVWSGFVFYNLARAYRKMFNLTNDEEDEMMAMRYYKKAGTLRRRWLNKIYWGRQVRNALSSEYFTSELDYIDFQDEVGLIDKEESLSEFNRLKTELGDYYNDDEKLEKLSLIQGKINEKIKNKSE